MCLKSCQGLLGSLWWKLLGTCFFFQGECQSQGGHFWHQVWFRHLHSSDDSYMTMGYGSVLGLSFGECMLVQCQQFWGLGLWLAHRDGRASAWDMSECRVSVDPYSEAHVCAEDCRTGLWFQDRFGAGLWLECPQVVVPLLGGYVVACLCI